MTDRGLYLPDDTIAVFGIARLGPGDAGGTLSVRLERPGEPRALVSAGATAGSLGDFHTTLHVPETASSVPHVVSVYSGARLLGQAWVQIAARHALPVALTVVPSQASYVAGESAAWRIMLSGRPSPAGRLAYRIIDNEARARRVLPSAEHVSIFDPDAPWRWTDLPVRQGEVHVSSATTRAAATESEHHWERCEVGYFEGREWVTAEAAVNVDSSAWELSTRVPQPAEGLGPTRLDPVVTLVNAAGDRVSGASVRVQARVAPGVEPIEGDAGAGPCDVVTADTPVTCHLTTPGKEFWLTTRTQELRGSSATESKYVSLSPLQPPLPLAIADVHTDKGSYQAGETAHVVVWSSLPSAAGALLIDAPGGPSEIRRIAIVDHTARVDVPLPPAFVPRVRLHARIYDSRTFDVTASDVAVRVLPAASAIALQVHLGQGDGGLFQSGQQVDVETSLTDASGGKIDGDVFLLVASEQIWRATQQTKTDWTSSIWGPMEPGWFGRHFGCKDLRPAPPEDPPHRRLPLLTTNLDHLQGTTVVAGPVPTGGGSVRIPVTLPSSPGAYRLIATALADHFRTGAYERAVEVVASPARKTSVR